MKTSLARQCLVDSVYLRLDTVKPMDLRSRILAASVRLIEEQGLGALSMREVARRAGVSHQAPYHHFADREAILAAVAEEGFRRLSAELEAAVARPSLAAIDRLVESGRGYVRFATSNPAHFRVMFRPELVDLEKHPSALAEAQRAFETLERLVGFAVEERVIEPRFAGGTVTLAWAFVHGLSGLVLDGPLAKGGDGASPEQRVEAALRAYGRLLSGPTSRRRSRRRR